ncbi:isoleucine--tRNA ligase [Aspergillus hancockii]|nr:isoleucine--tRNA ligase [Aspergillus hancockii]
MARRYQNFLKHYLDLNSVIERYGCDALRLYLIYSPVVRGEHLNFREAGVKGVLQKVLLPLWNSPRFFEELVRLLLKSEGFEFKFSPDRAASSGNVMDRLDIGIQGDTLIILDKTIYPELKTLRIDREVANRVQMLRKKVDLVPTDEVRVEYTTILSSPNEVGIEEAILRHMGGAVQKMSIDPVELQDNATSDNSADKRPHGVIIEEVQERFSLCDFRQFELGRLQVQSKYNGSLMSYNYSATT